MTKETQENGSDTAIEVASKAEIEVVDSKQLPNPFDELAKVFTALQTALDEKIGKDQKTTPRWVRIARARHALVPRPTPADGETVPAAKAPGTTPEEKISELIGKMVGGFVTALAYVAKLVLDLQDILIQSEAGVELINVSADLVTTVTSKDFTNGVAQVFGQDNGPDLTAVGDAMAAVKKVLKYVPREDALEKLSKSLFLLLRVVQHPPGAPGSEHSPEIDLDKTGKIRLLQWAYGRPYTVYGLGVGAGKPYETTYLGARRLEGERAATTLATVGDYRVLNVAFTGDPDVKEVSEILSLLGYVKEGDTSDGLEKALKDFQVVNELEVTGKIDNATLNRLCNLDDAAEQLRRARPFDAQEVERAQAKLAEKEEAAKKAVEEKKPDPTPEGIKDSDAVNTE